jgi:uroporphyrinogen-III synthase
MGSVPKRVILTRSEDDIERDRIHFEKLGFEVVPLPLIKSVPVGFTFGDKTYEWVIFQSVRAASHFLERCKLPRGAKVVAVGEKTRRFLENRGVRVDLVPSESSAEGIIRAMNYSNGERVLIPRSAIGRMELIEGLREKGYITEDLIVYDIKQVKHDPKRVEEVLGGGGFIVFASPSAVSSLFANLQKERAVRLLKGLKVLAIGKTTKKALEREGIRGVITPPKPLMEEVAGKIHSIWHGNCQ